MINLKIYYAGLNQNCYRIIFNIIILVKIVRDMAKIIKFIINNI